MIRFSQGVQEDFYSKPAYLFPAYDPGGSYSREVKVTQSCPTLCNPMDCTVHGILQDRILEWVAFPFSRGSSQPRDFVGKIPWRREKLPTPVCLPGEFHEPVRLQSMGSQKVRHDWETFTFTLWYRGDFLVLLRDLWLALWEMGPEIKWP